MRKLKIVFMGTPEFAVPMLDALVKSDHEIVGVITAPDKPAGRGMQLSESDVKKYATGKGLHLLQPEKLKNPDFLFKLQALNADLFVVVAFRMLPEVVWSMPPMGTINLHASLLPQYRGAAPINWAIINGEKETGVTTFFIQHEIDTGKIIFQEKIPIREDEDAGQLYQELMSLGAKVLRKTVDAIALNDYPQIPQDHITAIKHAPKIYKETCKINWDSSAETVYNFIRGLSPYPGAMTKIDGKTFKIFSCDKQVVSPENVAEPASYKTDGKTYLNFCCSNGAIAIKECQIEGKRRMGVEEFLRGYTPQSITGKI